MTEYPIAWDTEKRIRQIEDERAFLYSLRTELNNRIDALELELSNLRMQAGYFPKRVA